MKSHIKNYISLLETEIKQKIQKEDLNVGQDFFTNFKTRFPRKKTLETLRNFCIIKNLNDELVVSELDKFDYYSKKDHAIRQQAGRILGSDLIDYVASNHTELSDSLKKVPHDILQKLAGTIKEKSITKKTLLEYE